MISFARFLELPAEKLCDHVSLEMIQQQVVARKCSSTCSGSGKRCDVTAHDHHTPSKHGGFQVIPPLKLACPPKASASWTECAGLRSLRSGTTGRVWMALFRDPWSRLVSGYTSKFENCKHAETCFRTFYLSRFSLDQGRHSFVRYLQA